MGLNNCEDDAVCELKTELVGVGGNAKVVRDEEGNKFAVEE